MAAQNQKEASMQQDELFFEFCFYALLCISIDFLRIRLYRKMFAVQHGDETGDWHFKLQEYGLVKQTTTLFFFPLTTLAAFLHFRPKYFRVQALIVEFALHSKLWRMCSWMFVPFAIIWSITAAPAAIVYLVYRRFGHAYGIVSWFAKLIKGG